MLRIVVLFTLLFSAGVALGQVKEGSAKEERPAKREPLAITSEREAAVFEFVEEHHPALVDVLNYLKEHNEKRQYERAIRELYQASEKLAGWQKTDKARYELELKAWKAKSRVQLLSAKLAMGDDDELKQELKQALADQYDVRREILRLDRNRLRDRMKKLDRDLADHESKREATLEKQFEALTSAGVQRGKTNPTKERPVKGKPAKETAKDGKRS